MHGTWAPLAWGPSHGSQMTSCNTPHRCSFVCTATCLSPCGYVHTMQGSTVASRSTVHMYRRIRRAYCLHPPHGVTHITLMTVRTSHVAGLEVLLRTKSYGMWSCVAGLMFPDVEALGSSTSESEGTKFLRNVPKHLPSDTKSRPRRSEPWALDRVHCQLLSCKLVLAAHVYNKCWVSHNSLRCIPDQNAVDSLLVPRLLN